MNNIDHLKGTFYNSAENASSGENEGSVKVCIENKLFTALLREPKVKYGWVQ